MSLFFLRVIIFIDRFAFFLCFLSNWFHLRLLLRHWLVFFKIFVQSSHGIDKFVALSNQIVTISYSMLEQFILSEQL